MVVTDEAIQLDRPLTTRPPRRPIRRRLGIGTAIAVLAAVGLVALGLVAVVETSGPTSDQTPEPAPRTRDEIVRDLVERGVVPAAALDDGTQIASPGFEPVPRSRDDIVRDLVERGVVPAATLDDGTQITSPTPAP